MKDNKKVLYWVGSVAVALCIANQSAMALPISYNGGSYNQDFDTLSNVTVGTHTWTDGTAPLAGWHFTLENGLAPTSYIATSAATASQNQALSLGATGSSDRALGSQNGNTSGTVMRFGAALTNTSGGALTSFTLSFTGEQWRVITQETVNDRLDFSFQVFGSGLGSLGAAGYTDVDALDFIAPITLGAGSSTGLNGNLAANRTSVSFTVNGLNWLPGQDLWLRWSDTNNGGNPGTRSAMGIDDLTFSAIGIPEPTSIVLLSLCGVLMGQRRRRHA